MYTMYTVHSTLYKVLVYVHSTSVHSTWYARTYMYVHTCMYMLAGSNAATHSRERGTEHGWSDGAGAAVRYHNCVTPRGAQ